MYILVNIQYRNYIELYIIYTLLYIYIYLIWNTHLSQVALFVINSYHNFLMELPQIVTLFVKNNQSVTSHLIENSNLYNSSYRPLTIAYVYIDELLCITCRM